MPTNHSGPLTLAQRHALVEELQLKKRAYEQHPDTRQLIEAYTTPNSATPLHWKRWDDYYVKAKQESVMAAIFYAQRDAMKARDFDKVKELAATATALREAGQHITIPLPDCSDPNVFDHTEYIMRYKRIVSELERQYELIESMGGFPE